MEQNTWTAVDEYIQAKLIGPDDALDAALAANKRANLPAIDVAPNQGKLLHLLVQMCSARRVLEIGALGGYSTIWLARALSADGRLITLEADPKHAEVAARNIRCAKLDHLVDLRLGPALATLPQLARENLPPFDFVFIDADKPNTPAYLDWALQMSRPGTVIVADNVIRNGNIIDSTSADPGVQGMRSFFDLLAADKRLTATALQTVGSKGYDGFAVAIVKETPSVRGSMRLPRASHVTLL